MDHLWAPWRREFIDAPKEEGCIFCRYPAETGREADRIAVARHPHIHQVHVSTFAHRVLPGAPHPFRAS